jgi:hypothetical protein
LSIENSDDKDNALKHLFSLAHITYEFNVLFIFEIIKRPGLPGGQSDTTGEITIR